MLIAGNTAGLSADVRPEYDPEPHRWDHLATTLQRLASYGPGWGSPWVYGGLVAAMLGLLALGPVLLRHKRTLVVVIAALALFRGLVWAASIPQLDEWKWLEHVSIFKAVNPVEVAVKGETLAFNAGILGGIGLLGLILGMIVFSWRDLPAGS